MQKNNLLSNETELKQQTDPIKQCDIAEITTTEGERRQRKSNASASLPRRAPFFYRVHSTDSTVPSRELDASSVSFFERNLWRSWEDGGTVRQQEFSNLGGSVTNSIQYVETVRNTESPMKLRWLVPPKNYRYNLVTCT